MLSDRPSLKVSYAVAGSKVCSRRSTTSTPASAIPHRLQARSPRVGQAHAVGCPCQQFVIEQFAQASEVVAHRGLADPDARRRPCHAPFGQQRVEVNEQVQVDAT